MELDELWSFVGCKARVRRLWVAFCRRIRQVVAYVLGDRSEQTCRRLWERIPEDYRLAVCYTDFWESYLRVVPEDQHAPVGKQSGETNHVERWNHTLRQRLGRFVRKTLSSPSAIRCTRSVCVSSFTRTTSAGLARQAPTL